MLVPPKKKPQKKARRVFNGGYSPEQIAKGLTPLEARIARYEEFLPSVVKDELANGLPTVGFGFADPDVVKKYLRGITLDQAKAELKIQVKRAQNGARAVLGDQVWGRLNQNQKDALTSYYYNYPFHNNPNSRDKSHYSPKMIAALQRQDYNEAARQMDAGWNQAPGLRKRRIEEQQLFLTPMQRLRAQIDAPNMDIYDDPSYLDDYTMRYNPAYGLPQQQNNYYAMQQFAPIYMPKSVAIQDDVYSDQADPYDYQSLSGDVFRQDVSQLQNDALQYAQQYAYNNQNSYYPIMQDYRLPQYSMGKDTISINPRNRGKFTETMRRTGKTAEELSHSENPLTRKRAIFALNARKWNK